MAIALIGEVGRTVYQFGQLSVTVGLAVPAGSRLVIYAATAGDPASFGVSDNRGNAYRRVGIAYGAQPTFRHTFGVALVTAHVTTPLQVGDVITLSVSAAALVLAFSGVAEGDAWDLAGECRGDGGFYVPVQRLAAAGGERLFVGNAVMGYVTPTGNSNGHPGEAFDPLYSGATVAGPVRGIGSAWDIFRFNAFSVRGLWEVTSGAALRGTGGSYTDAEEDADTAGVGHGGVAAFLVPAGEKVKAPQRPRLVERLGSASAAAGMDGVSITISQAVPAGTRLTVPYMAWGSPPQEFRGKVSGVSACTDSRGNVYWLDQAAQAGLGNGLSTGQFSTVLTTALQPGDTVQVGVGQPAWGVKAAAVIRWAGVHPAFTGDSQFSGRDAYWGGGVWGNQDRRRTVDASTAARADTISPGVRIRGGRNLVAGVLACWVALEDGSSSSSLPALPANLGDWAVIGAPLDYLGGAGEPVAIRAWPVYLLGDRGDVERLAAQLQPTTPYAWKWSATLVCYRGGAASLRVWNLHDALGRYHRAEEADGDVTYRRSDHSTPPFAVTAAVTSAGTDAEPRMAIGARGRIHLLFARESAGVMETVSDDDGATWSEPELMFADGTHPFVAADPLTGAILRAAFIDGGLWGSEQAPGEAAPGATFRFLDAAGAPLAVADDGYAVAHAPEAAGRALLTLIIDGEDEPSDWQSWDSWRTWTRIS